MTTPVEIFSQIWAQHLPTYPLIVTVNVPVDTNDLPDVWASSVDMPRESPDASMGSRPWVVQRGSILIGLFTRAGTGPAALDTVVADVRRIFQGAALNGLHILQVDGPVDIDPEADGEWWRLAVTAEYEFQTRRDTTGPLQGWEGMSA